MEQVSAPSLINTKLEKPWLLPLRLLWLAASLIALGLFVAGLPLRAREIHNWYGGNIEAGLTENQAGEVVVSTWPGSASAQAGVLQDDVLLAVDGVPVVSLEQAKTLTEGVIGSQVTVSVRTGNFPPRQLMVTRGSLAGEVLLNYGLSSQFAVGFVLTSEILFALLCVGIAGVIFWYRPDDWMALFSALIIIVILVGLSLPVLALADSLQNGGYPLWIDTWYALGFGSLILFFYLFPVGRFTSYVTFGLAAVLGLWLTLGLFNRSLLLWYQPRLTFVSLGLAWVASGVASLVLRYRQSESVQRQQILWIVWGASASAVGLMLQIFPTLFELSPSTRLLYDFVLYPLGQILKACLPLSIGFAILRYRLWNIELVLNRLLVYGSLSVLTMLGYLGAVFILQALFTGLSNPITSFFATGVVAVLFEPLRRRLQRAVNRMMYGERDDPYVVLTRLAGTLEHISTTNEVLPSIAQTIGQTLKIPYVAILLDQDGAERLAASFGEPVHELLSFPLVYHSEVIGRLQLARRAPNEQFLNTDLGLIESIAHQAGAAAQTVRLNAELIRSRTQIVNEREDERLRIRRDLHDELGPMLASQSFKLAAARQVIRTKPETAESLVDEIIQQSQQTIADVRRLVHGLRPPALDQLGLVEAVRDLVRNEADGLNFDVSAPTGGLPSLPAAVEVNAYRIVLEALNNAVKHARASHCIVRFSSPMTDSLVIHIEDDGVGMPKEYRPGVGLRSMRARAEEIGGELHIESLSPRGTQLVARLPLVSAQEREYVK
ncbi:MAG TPA: histidine kinase [Anaerolineales bacterium]|nr:histidine kinase [Anaerolineales bacterium]